MESTKVTRPVIRCQTSDIPCEGVPTLTRWIFPFELTNYRSGVPSPFYKTQIKNATNATTPFQAYKQTLNYVSGYQKQRLTSPGCPNIGLIINDSLCGLVPEQVRYPCSGAVKADARNAAAIGIRNKIQSETQAFSGLTFLGELRESIHQIRHPAEAAFALADKYFFSLSRKYRGSGKKAVSKAIAASWLEFTFGLEPLIDDINKIAASSLGRCDEDRVKRISYTGYAQSQSTSRVQGGTGSGWADYLYYRQDIDMATHKYIVGIRRKVDARQQSLRNVIDLGYSSALDVIPATWELIPWSFFIDYFTNIGDVLNASTVSLSNVAWVNSTTRGTRFLKMDSGVAVARYPGHSEMMDGALPRCYATYSDVVRDIGSIDIPSIEFRIPGSTRKYFNIAALATLQFVKF